MRISTTFDGAVRRLSSPVEFMTVLALGYALLTPIFAKPRFEPFVLALGCLALQMSGKRIRDLFERFVPYLIFVLSYDALRYGRDAFLTTERVTVCEIRQLELRLLPIGSDETIGDWVQLHTSKSLDLLFAAPYLVFAFVVFVYGLYLYSVDRPRMSRFLWSFCVANLVANVIWLALPVAPPWYHRIYGCVVDLAAAPSAAGLRRVDALLGIPYFQTFYGKAIYVFGAMPSLHCTYPMIGLLTAWRHTSWKKTRLVHCAYVLLMFCASVYLDHHYVLDGLAGFVLAGCSVWMVTRVEARLAARQPSLAQVAT